jgi:hypothetical protein
MISKEMGVTRNAVIGKVTRLKLPRREIIHRSQYKRAGRVITEKVARKRPQPRRSKFEGLSAHSPAQRLVRNSLIMNDLASLGELCELPSFQSPFARTIIDLSDGQCRFPVDRPPGATTSMQYFCGDSVVKGSYCECHRRLAYRKSTSAFESIGSVALRVVEKIDAQRRTNDRAA